MATQTDETTKQLIWLAAAVKAPGCWSLAAGSLNSRDAGWSFGD